MGISFDILVVIGRRRRGRLTATCFRTEPDNILRAFDSDEMPFACPDGFVYFTSRSGGDDRSEQLRAARIVVI